MVHFEHDGGVAVVLYRHPSAEIVCQGHLKKFKIRNSKLKIRSADCYTRRTLTQAGKGRRYGLVARTSGDGPGASSLRTFLKPASSSQLLISLKLKVSPFSLLTSICTANMSEWTG